MLSFLKPSVLQTEYNFGWLKINDLKKYIGWGYITEAQYNDIINHRTVNP